MSKKRRNHSVEFKAKVALAALKGDKMLSELVQQLDVHPNQITQWKPQVVDHVSQLFAKELLGEAEAEDRIKELQGGPGRTKSFSAEHRSNYPFKRNLPSAEQFYSLAA